VVHRLSTDEDVIADGSRPYILPTIAGKHSDLKSISPETVSEKYLANGILPELKGFYAN
jgi:hypothetical protein